MPPSVESETRSSEFPRYLKKIGLIKFEILASGLKVTDAAWEYVGHFKGPIRTRSGASGGLDIILPHDVYVNSPVNEDFVASSQLALDLNDGELVIARGQEVVCEVRLQPIPNYYQLKTVDGLPMVTVGQMCSGDRFCYGMTGPHCFFWQRGMRCKFCSIGLNRTRDAVNKTVEQMIETLERAIADPNIPAKHLLIGGGTPDGDDMGAKLASDVVRSIKKRFDISCYVMICAPLDNEYIDMLHDAGTDELGMNIELYSEDAWKSFIPGKDRFIGRKRYFEALEYAATVFGPINTRSLLIVGLEDPQHTIKGAERLASMGVMPILSPFRPLKGTDLEDVRGFDYLTYWDVYVEVHSKSMQYGVPTGPTCIPCQNNTLALPLNSSHYRFY